MTPFTLIAVAQSGRLSYEAVLLLASLRARSPSFPGRVIFAEPQPGPLWQGDPRIADPQVRSFLLDNGAEILPFASRHFGQSYPYGNKIEALASLPPGPFLFLDTDTLILSDLAQVPFDFSHPSASMRREGTWPTIEAYGPGYTAIWRSLYDRFNLDFASSLDMSQPDEYWQRYLYFNAGWFFGADPQAFGQRFTDHALSIRDDRPAALVLQELNPWLDQIALPLVIHSFGGTRPGPELSGMDGTTTCHYRTLPLLYARESDEAVQALEQITAPNRVKKVLKAYEPFRRMLYQGKGAEARALFDRENLPHREQAIRNRLKAEGLWLMSATIYEGAQVILPDRLARVSVRVEGGVITGLDAPRDGATPFDATGLILAPALVDIHGDAFERQLMPRPGVHFPLDAALLETDRQLAANGIATAYHALTLSWEPGLRSVQTGTAIFESLQRLAPRLTVENRLQLRWETFCFEALPLIEAALAATPAPSIAFNDHTSMILLHPDTALQDRPFDHDPAFPITPLDHPKFLAKIAERAKRVGLPAPDLVTLIDRIWSRRAEVPAVMERVAAMGRAHGTPMLSHDDSRPETRSFYRALGARISEFPMNLAAAENARANGDWIIFGAPNAARGGSHLGSPGAGEMLARGLCDILASDYFYPAMLAAVGKLQSEGHALPDLWKLVSTNPARASGLTDRGEIAPGQRADLVLLDWPEGEVPSPRRTLVAGRTAYAASGAGV